MKSNGRRAFASFNENVASQCVRVVSIRYLLFGLYFLLFLLYLSASTVSEIYIWNGINLS